MVELSLFEDMTIRNFSPEAQRSYISAVSKYQFGLARQRLD